MDASRSCGPTRGRLHRFRRTPLRLDTPSIAARGAVARKRSRDTIAESADIVFGFAVSQCAIQLPTANGCVDLANPLIVAAYFGTSAILVAFWLTFYRTMSGRFRPARLDLFHAFAYLAFVSLVPFAMYSVTHRAASAGAARMTFAEYAAIFSVVNGVRGGHSVT